MGRPRIAHGAGDLQIRTIAENILNEELRTADKRWSTAMGVRQGAKNSSQKKFDTLQNVAQGLGPGRVI